MAEIISAKAPGKILWLGGYSILERPNIGFVTTVNSYVTAKLQLNNNLSVNLNAPQLNMSAAGAIEESGAIKVNAAKELLLFKTAAEVSLRYAKGLGAATSGFNITTGSDPAFAYSLSSGKVVKSGLGSSAAVTVATVGSVLKAFDISFAENDALHKLAQLAHSLATGKVGSGFDVAAATHGSILYTRYSPAIISSLPQDYTNEQLVELIKRPWDYVIEKFTLPKQLKLLFANFGESMITAQAVGSVSEFKKNDPDAYKILIKDLNDENVKAAEALKRINMDDNDYFQVFADAFNKGRALTKRLGELSKVGIEPDDCTLLIEESSKKGAFVSKLPGAGGKDAIAALALGEDNRVKLRDFWSTRKELRILDIDMCNTGFEFESAR